jgi:transaldolase/glucose-6-phosphate isomerase
MGGSSLAPEVYQRTLGNQPGSPQLVVLDSTHPDAVLAAVESLDLETTLFVVASKSGGTLETLSLFKYAWHRLAAVSDSPGQHFVAITDPGTSLEATARELQFREIFGAPPEVGGRFSALSVFGLVPAALIGTSLERLIGPAQSVAVACAEPDANPGLELGAILAELAIGGRDKLTFVTTPTVAALPDWIEQLVAESTGKHGNGILPVVGEPLAEPAAYGSDRLFIRLSVQGEEDAATTAALERIAEAGHPVVDFCLEDPYAVGQEMFRWEVAVASAGAALAINPFDQPDVQLAKELARQAMAGETAAAGAEPPTAGPAARLGELLDQGRAGDYVAIQAFLAASPELSDQLSRLQGLIRDRSHLATVVGYGPRFLHSTGQLHKGGPDSGLFVQLVDSPARDLEVPDTDYSFGRLIAAQAAGDLAALKQRGRRTLRINLGGSPEAALAALIGELGG